MRPVLTLVSPAKGESELWLWSSHSGAAYNIDVYSPQLLDHFEHPRNPGILTGANASVQLDNPVCGDVLKLMAIFERGVIHDIRFQAKGCVPSIACASALTELVHGKSLAAASSVSREDVIRAVGGIPQASTHAVQLAVDCLKALLAAVSDQQVKT